MQKTQAEIDTLSAINQQLRDEGALQQIIDLAEGLAKGRFGSERDDKIGAIKLITDALAFMIARSPFRPTCCVTCQMKHIETHLQVLAICYSEVVAQEKGKGNDSKPH